MYSVDYLFFENKKKCLNYFIYFNLDSNAINIQKKIFYFFSNYDEYILNTAHESLSAYTLLLEINFTNT